MDAAPPQPPAPLQVLERLIAFTGDTATADKVKDKPSVVNSSPASLAVTLAPKSVRVCVRMFTVCHHFCAREHQP